MACIVSAWILQPASKMQAITLHCATFSLPKNLIRFAAFQKLQQKLQSRPLDRLAVPSHIMFSVVRPLDCLLSGQHCFSHGDKHSMMPFWDDKALTVLEENASPLLLWQP